MVTPGEPLPEVKPPALCHCGAEIVLFGGGSERFACLRHPFEHFHTCIPNGTRAASYAVPCQIHPRKLEHPSWPRWFKRNAARMEVREETADDGTRIVYATWHGAQLNNGRLLPSTKRKQYSLELEAAYLDYWIFAKDNGLTPRGIDEWVAAYLARPASRK